MLLSLFPTPALPGSGYWVCSQHSQKGGTPFNLLFVSRVQNYHFN